MPDCAAGDSRHPGRRVIVSGMTGYRACPATPRAAGTPRPYAEFRVLGRFEAITAGRPVPVTPAERTVLHVLLLFCGQRCPADLLFRALWGAAWPADPAGALRACAAGAARAVHPWADITTEAGGYRATARAGTLDLARFRQRRGQAAAAACRGDLPAAAAALRQALGCWQSDAITGLPAVAEVDAEAVGLLEERHIAGHDLAGLWLQLGWYRDALPALRDRAAAEPGCEQAAAQLMHALLMTGRPVEAFGAYRAARRWLAAELGLEPGPQLQDMLGWVLTGTPPPGPTVAASLQGSFRIARPGAARRGTACAPGSRPASARPSPPPPGSPR